MPDLEIYLKQREESYDIYLENRDKSVDVYLDKCEVVSDIFVISALRREALTVIDIFLRNRNVFDKILTFSLPYRLYLRADDLIVLESKIWETLITKFIRANNDTVVSAHISHLNNMKSITISDVFRLCSEIKEMCYKYLSSTRNSIALDFSATSVLRRARILSELDSNILRDYGNMTLEDIDFIEF